ncbi:hypothetical protein BAUCODRAFT_22915 [Baudoinia panamericana UAMH 10762]|uniref:ADF-H domain-containing protein n=1 Tax=Baudoinia panamericana (strain UAMH 10762) TaxID=717646 RepID=M2MN24_BAUPA|nr:uncharacterized protein BAUCODRAFT_22915 [Baudoinia panamericana UAMH 10762]EMC98076.1 hypothetical protein BAUCODRAFT_22915 [Baudoinia panamericana UAMH 10762]
MSLNGLDHPAVVDAYNSAIAEAGGWFLLLYVSRDSVELLGRGKGGVLEARAELAKYEDQSPLYGLLIYRRRKILIKYVPEGTSRLLQARTAVHIQEFLQRYSPYETLLEISNSDELNDTSLAASFPLHTASTATSSNRLNEISEDGEDHGAVPERPSMPAQASSTSLLRSQRWKTEMRMDQLVGGDRARKPPPSIQITSENSSPITSPLASPGKTSISQFLVWDESGKHTMTSLGSQPSLASITDYAGSEKSGKSAESTTTAGESGQTTVAKPMAETTKPAPMETPSDKSTFPERAASVSSDKVSAGRSSISERPSLTETARKSGTEEPYDFSYLDSKPKVKLGPRLVSEGKRATAATVSAMPATLRMAQKKTESVSRPKSQGPGTALHSFPGMVPAPPPIPNVPEYNPRPVSRGSVKSMPSHKSTALTPDKVRLMKAVELRKKQLRKSNPQAATFKPPADEEKPAVPEIPSGLKSAPDPQAEKAHNRDPEAEMQMSEEQPASSKKADSGIEMSYDDAAHRERISGAPSTANEALQASSDPATLQQLQSGSPKAKLLKLETSNEHLAERAIEHDTQPKATDAMLGEGLSKSHFAHLQSSAATDSPAFGRTPDAVHTSPITEPEAAKVPAIVMADGSQPMTHSRQASRNDVVPEPVVENETAPSQDEQADIEIVDGPKLGRRQNSDLAKRRRGIVEPLHIEAQSEGDLDSDDEFLEELQTATLQQAKPMTMRSPILPSFPRRPSAQSVHSDRSAPSVRSVTIRKSSSNLVDRVDTNTEHGSPQQEDAQTVRDSSVSTPPYERNDPLQGYSKNMSLGITRRIQALADLSGQESASANPAQSPTSETSPLTTWRERKGAVRSPPGSRTPSMKAAARYSGRSSGHSALASPPLSQGENAPVYNIQHDPTLNRDSVSVTARIVRTSMIGETEEVVEDGRLQQSQLVINHKRASGTQARNTNKPLPPLNTDQPIHRVESAPPMGPNELTGSGPVEHRTMHSASRRSFGRHRQAPMSPITPSADDFPPPPVFKSFSTTSITSASDENAAVKDSSRTSRWLKRMSNLGSKDKRRSGALLSSAGSSAADVTSPATAATRNPSIPQHDKADMPPPVVLGDLNAQFPDSLLWKRRIVTLDGEGNVLYAIPQALDVHKGTAPKKYHLSEFKIPYAPDLDRQELPHSIMLDFIDGGTTLQAACEDAMTQRQVLHVLRSYWKAWATNA